MRSLRRWWQSPRFDNGIKAVAMTSVSNWLVLRPSATTQGDRVSARKIKVLPLGIPDNEISRNSKWAVGITDNDGRFVHSFLQYEGDCSVNSCWETSRMTL